MNIQELYDYLVDQLGSPEIVLKKMLETSVEQYTVLSQIISKGGNIPNEALQGGGSAVFIAAALAQEMGWDFLLEKSDNLRGISMGTNEYLQELNTNPSSLENSNDQN